MAWSKTVTTAIVSGCLILALAGGTVIFVKKRSARRLAILTHLYDRAHLQDPGYKAILADLRAHEWRTEKRAEEEKIASRQRKDETVNSSEIDLTPYLNAALTDSPASPADVTGNNLAALPSGAHVFAGVPFDVEGLIQLDGGDMARFKKHYPTEVDNIRIGRTCAKLHLLHGANWVYPSTFGSTAAKLVLHYSDGSVREIDLIVGQQVFDFWSPLFTTGLDLRYSQTAPGTERAWTGSNPFLKKMFPDESLILYKSTFDNPQPNVTLSAADYVSGGMEIAPFLVGLTVE